MPIPPPRTTFNGTWQIHNDGLKATEVSCSCAILLLLFGNEVVGCPVAGDIPRTKLELRIASLPIEGTCNRWTVIEEG